MWDHIVCMWLLGCRLDDVVTIMWEWLVVTSFNWHGVWRCILMVMWCKVNVWRALSVGTAATAWPAGLSIMNKLVIKEMNSGIRTMGLLHIWGRVLLIFILILVYCWLLHRTHWLLALHIPKHLSISFPLPLSWHYNAWKDLMMCTLQFYGKELENLDKPMVVCIIGMNFEWTYIIFQTHEWEW